MPNPTRQEILDAHHATQRLAELATHADGYITDEDVPHAYQNMILAALPPRPQPTMAEVEWDDNEHYLAEAEHSAWGKVIMIDYDEGLERILYICYEKPGRTGFASPKNLNPTGYQCTLTEVQDD